MMQKPLVLLPAAGFGTRVGSPEAKELMLGPQGRPLIDSALEQAAVRSWPVHVITRKEKRSLIQYLQSKNDIEISIQVIEPSREWPDTLFKSKPFWRERNLLCLPDTQYAPLSIWDRLASSQAPLAAAVFSPPAFDKWGVLRKADSNRLEICEKPQDQREQMRAWGLLSFTKAIGEALFSAQLESTFDHQWKSLTIESEFFELDAFEDLTRAR
jgi:hypothetical protein